MHKCMVLTLSLQISFINPNSKQNESSNPHYRMQAEDGFALCSTKERKSDQALPFQKIMFKAVQVQRNMWGLIEAGRNKLLSKIEMTLNLLSPITNFVQTVIELGTRLDNCIPIKVLFQLLVLFHRVNEKKKKNMTTQFSISLNHFI